MPILEKLSQTILIKKSIDDKYGGGVVQFKKDYSWGSESDSEDEEVLVFSFMNGHLDKIKDLTLDIDYVHVSRYDNKTQYGVDNWLKFNHLYYWHKDSISASTHPDCTTLNLTMDDMLEKVNAQGGLKTIW